MDFIQTPQTSSASAFFLGLATSTFKGWWWYVLVRCTQTRPSIQALQRGWRANLLWSMINLMVKELPFDMGP